MRLDKWSAVIDGARWAPSAYNAQPWRFRLDENVLEIISRPERWRPVVDPRNRETLISVGSLIHSLRHTLGSKAEEELLISHPYDDKIARFSLPDSEEFDTGGSVRAAELEKLRTCRREYRHEPLSSGALERLKIVGKERIAFYPKGSEENRALVAGSLEAAVAHANSREIYTELSRFVASPSRRERRSWGVDAPVGESQRLYPHSVSRRPRTDRRAYRGATITATRDLLSQAPLLLTLEGDSRDPRDLLQVGILYQQLRLEAAALGLATQPVSVLPQMVEAGKIDPPGAFERAQMVLRIGVPVTWKKAPRGMREPTETLLVLQDDESNKKRNAA